MRLAIAMLDDAAPFRHYGRQRELLAPRHAQASRPPVPPHSTPNQAALRTACTGDERERKDRMGRRASSRIKGFAVLVARRRRQP